MADKQDITDALNILISHFIERDLKRHRVFPGLRIGNASRRFQSSAMYKLDAKAAEELLNYAEGRYTDERAHTKKAYGALICRLRWRLHPDPDPRLDPNFTGSTNLLGFYTSEQLRNWVMEMARSAND